jgi:serine/threonine protein kinase
MGLAPGTRIGPFELLDSAGAGGMGEVYRARDTKLQRDVALKILPEAFVRDPDSRARLVREAQVLASLNHPNIAAIYGLEEVDGTHALALEFVEGQTLAELIAAGSVPPDEAVRIARQIVDGLAAAHERGIVHRDLKPANVKLRPDGTVKILDFGLAKALSPGSGENAAGAAAVTQTGTPATRVGVILGTPAYMSPEQARGLAVDRRTDVWAFGCVLYELLTGVRPFTGDSSQVLAAILRADPDWKLLPAETPSAVRRALRRCLAKDVNARFADIRDVHLDLDAASDDAPAVTVATRAISWRERALWGGAVVLLAALPLLRPRTTATPASSPELRVEIAIPATSDPVSLAISPDGQQIAYVASPDGPSQLWIRSLQTGETRPIRGTVGATLPFWSPDGRSIGFFTGERLYRVDVDGGTPRVVTAAIVATGGAWTSRGSILFPTVPDAPVMRVPQDGGDAVPALPPPAKPLGGGQRFPQALPDGEHFLFYVRETRSVYLGRVGDPEPRRLFESDAAAVFAPPDRVLFVRERRLLEQTLDMPTLQPAGEPRQIAEGILVDSRGVAALSASVTGAILYRTGEVDQQRRLVWYDRSGRQIRVAVSADTAFTVNPSLSPDERHVALTRSIDGNTDVWILDDARGTLRRFTSYPGPDIVPVWAPDGGSVLYSKATAHGGFSLYRKARTEDGSETPLNPDIARAVVLDWSRDGRFILYRTIDPQNRHGWDIWALARDAPRNPFPVLASPFDQRTAVFSPDGQWIAYESNESGRFDVYVHPFPGPGEKVPVSTSGGSRPRWRQDGSEIFYVDEDGDLMSVAVRKSAGGLDLAKEAVRLFPTMLERTVEGGISHGYAVSGDGKRFLLSETVPHAPATLNLIVRPRN